MELASKPWLLWLKVIQLIDSWHPKKPMGRSREFSPASRELLYNHLFGDAAHPWPELTHSLQGLEKADLQGSEGVTKSRSWIDEFFHRKKIWHLNSHGFFSPEKRYTVTKILRNYTSATVRRMLLDPELQSSCKNVQTKTHFGWHNPV